MIKYLLDKDGGFTCGDTATRLTSYAYPTSSHAQQAHKAPDKVVAIMLHDQTRYGFTHEADYDCRNWTKLGMWEEFYASNSGMFRSVSTP